MEKQPQSSDLSVYLSSGTMYARCSESVLEVTKTLIAMLWNVRKVHISMLYFENVYS